MARPKRKRVQVALSWPLWDLCEQYGDSILLSQAHETISESETVRRLIITGLQAEGFLQENKIKALREYRKGAAMDTYGPGKE